MFTKPIEYYNRYTNRVEVEAVYGERFLLWAYGTRLGRLGMQALFKRVFFSRFYGWLMDRPSSRSKIGPFIKHYRVSMQDFSRKVDEYKTFNEFFIRELRPGARPINTNSDKVVFPADARHLGFQDISKVNGIFVKGQQFDLEALLGSREEAKRYSDGSLVISRLCPVDYHRFHAPVSGVIKSVFCVNGSLYSVNPLALRRNIKILSENKRMVTVLETENFGRVLMLEVGATCVGSIMQKFSSGSSIQKGDEKGYFRFGGSTTILIFERGQVQLSPDLLEHSAQCRELYAQMGDVLGGK